jgi:hypothetical protein
MPNLELVGDPAWIIESAAVPSPRLLSFGAISWRAPLQHP